MKIKAYIVAYGKKEEVLDLHAQANLSGSRFQYHENVVSRFSVIEREKPWSWRTRRVDIDPDDFDGDIEDFLCKNRKLCATICSKKRSLDFISLVVIAKYDDKEDPRGFILSRKSISILSKMGSAFEVDSVRIMSNNEL